MGWPLPWFDIGFENTCNVMLLFDIGFENTCNVILFKHWKLLFKIQYQTLS